MANTAPATTQTRLAPAQQTITALPTDKNFGPGRAYVKQTNAANRPAATASGLLAPGQTVRTITRRPPAATPPSRTIDRNNIDASVFGNNTQA